MADRKGPGLFDRFSAPARRNQCHYPTGALKLGLSIVHVDGIGSEARRTSITEHPSLRCHRLTAVPAAGQANFERI